MFTVNVKQQQQQQPMSYIISLSLHSDTPVLCIYFLKQNRAIVPDKIHENYPGKNIYRKDPKFSDRSSGHTVQTEFYLSFHTATPPREARLKVQMQEFSLLLRK